MTEIIYIYEAIVTKAVLTILSHFCQIFPSSFGNSKGDGKLCLWTPKGKYRLL